VDYVVDSREVKREGRAICSIVWITGLHRRRVVRRIAGHMQDRWDNGVEGG
jgi:hypothetical protein